MRTGQTALFETEGDGQTPVAWPTPTPAKRGPKCGTPQVIFCGCRAKVGESHCNRLDCPNCAPHLRERRARRIWRRLMAKGPTTVLYTVFTLPERLRAKAANVAWWTRKRRAMWQWLKENCGALYGCERTDPAGQCDQARKTGEYCDCEKCSKWHPHLNFLWVQRPTGFRPFLDLEAMKAAWKKILGEKHLVDATGGEMPVSLHHEYRAPSADDWELKVRHWCSYLGRPWPHWIGVVKKHITLRWLGGKAVPKIGEEPPATCPDCGEVYGVLSARTKEAAEEIAAKGPVWCASEKEWEQLEIDLRMEGKGSRPRRRKKAVEA